MKSHIMTDAKKKKSIHLPSSPQILWHANTTRYTVCWYCLPTYVSLSSSLSSAFCITALKNRDSDNPIVKTGCLYELRKKKIGARFPMFLAFACMSDWKSKFVRQYLLKNMFILFLSCNYNNRIENFGRLFNGVACENQAVCRSIASCIRMTAYVVCF